MGLKEISREQWDAAELEQNYPANWVHEHKKLIVEQAGGPYAGTIEVSRWEPIEPHDYMYGSTLNFYRAGYFNYEPSTTFKMHWHVNFANREVFVGYGDGLLAQDEIQCLEHPVLANVREALVASSISRPLTVEYHKPTPILVKGVERRCSLDTEKIYGQKLATATKETVLESTHVIDPPTISNIIAMEAPFGRGPYQRDQIKKILTTAITGFSAAVRESKYRTATIHTGYWGCGAYGGNREIMALLQMLAAKMANVTKLVFHFGDKSGLEPYYKAAEFFRKLKGVFKVQEIIDKIYDHKYVWGMGNGT